MSWQYNASVIAVTQWELNDNPALQIQGAMFVMAVIYVMIDKA